MNEHKLTASRKRPQSNDLIVEAIEQYQKDNISVKQLVDILNIVNPATGRYVPGESKVEDDWQWSYLIWLPLFLSLLSVSIVCFYSQ